MAGLNALLGKSSTNTMAAAESSKQPPETVEVAKVNDSSYSRGVDDNGDWEDENRDAKLIATSAPIQRFKVGRFQFDRGVLNLYSTDDVEEFRGLVKTLPPADRRLIKVIDREAAERMVRPIEPGMTKQFDSSVGRQGDSIAGAKTIGDEPLEGPAAEGQGERFAKVAQMDNNAPVAGSAGNHVANAVNQGDVQTPEQIEALKKAQESDGKSI